MNEAEGIARARAQVGRFFTHRPAWAREPFVLPELPESLPAPIPPWEPE